MSASATWPHPLRALDGAGADDENDFNLRGVVVVATTNRPEAVSDRRYGGPAGSRARDRGGRAHALGAPRDFAEAHARAAPSVAEAQADALRPDAPASSPPTSAPTLRGAQRCRRARVVGREDQTLVAEDLASKLGSSLRLASRRRFADCPSSRSVTGATQRRRRARRANAARPEPRDFGDDADRVTFADFLAARRRVAPARCARWRSRPARGRLGRRRRARGDQAAAARGGGVAGAHGDACAAWARSRPRERSCTAPRGCSKTMLARAVASASGRNFVTVTGPELLAQVRGRVGEGCALPSARAAASAPG